MNERIKELRKKLGLTQTEFGEKIAMRQTGVAWLESGDRKITDRVITTICAVFDVNETWLRTGEGEMFRTASPDAELMKMFGHLFADDAPKAAKLKKKLIRELLKLDDQQFESAMNFAKRLTEDDEE